PIWKAYWRPIGGRGKRQPEWLNRWLVKSAAPQITSLRFTNHGSRFRDDPSGRAHRFHPARSAGALQSAHCRARDRAFSGGALARALHREVWDLVRQTALEENDQRRAVLVRLTPLRRVRRAATTCPDGHHRRQSGPRSRQTAEDFRAR